MENQIGWSDIALRLSLTVAAGAVFGANRGEHGHPAGLRTTLLVALAAAISMIQVNLLLPVAGKAQNSYVVMDLMRLPLGILSGMGFIGAGAILRRDNLVRGVTTAATLWFVTVMGLCFGGGQIGLGLSAFLLGAIILLGLKPLEAMWKQERQAALTITCAEGAPGESEIIGLVNSAGFKVSSVSVAFEAGGSLRELKCVVKWRGREKEVEPPAFVGQLARARGVPVVSWRS